MVNREVEKEMEQIESAKAIDVHDGPLGQEKVTTVERFVDCLLNVPYLPQRKSSDYAIHKPVRILLKSYRMFRNLPLEERRFQMAAQLRQVFISPPTGIFGPALLEVEDKTFQVVDEFLKLLGFLYADIPSLVSRNENRLIHAVDLAVQLRSPHAWLTFRLNRAQRQLDQIRDLFKSIQSTQMKATSEEEKTAQLNKLREELEEKQKKLMEDLDYLKKRDKREEAEKIATELQTIKQQGSVS